MTTEVLGSYSFLETPTVNGMNLIPGSGVNEFSTGLFSGRPIAGLANRYYLATDSQILYRDTGSAWVEVLDGNGSFVKQMVTGQVFTTSGASQIPLDATTPLVTEGTMIWSTTFTPTVVNSKSIIEFTGFADSSQNTRTFIISFFRDSVCIGATTTYVTTAGRPSNFAVCIVDTSTSLTPVTYSCRVGLSGSGTWYLNRNATQYFAGMLDKNFYKITEI